MRQESTLVQRMVGAARLDPRVFEEVEHDRGATPQALMVVVLVALATGIGGLGAAGAGAMGILFGAIVGVASWVIWAFITYAVGTTLFRTPETDATWSQLARTTGFAQAPGVLRIVGFVPGIGPVVFFAASLWQFAAMVVAVRQALDYRSTWRALGVVAVGFIVLIIFQGLFVALT